MDEQPEKSVPEDSPVRQPMPRGLLPWAIIGGVLLAVTAGLFVWQLRRRVNRIECSTFGAIAVLRSIAAGQNSWHRNDYDGNDILDYTPNYRNLYYQPDENGKPVAFIQKYLADASGPGGVSWNGYLFADITGDADGPYDYKFEFGACAYPANYKEFNGITYITNATGYIYRKDTGGKPITVWPKDPEKAGWILIH